MSYKKLEIWQLAKELSIEIHTMTLSLPKFEQFEEAQQIRRSSKFVRSTIVEGYADDFTKQILLSSSFMRWPLTMKPLIILRYYMKRNR